MIPYAVYCIALEKRRKHAEEFVQSLGYYNTIFPDIVYADKLDHADLVKRKLILPSFPKTKAYMGKMACTLSHMKVYSDFLDSDFTEALVFEDDNAMPKEPKQLRKILDGLVNIKKWEFLNLSPCWSKCILSQPAFQTNQLNFYHVTGQCANAYFIRKPAAKFWLRNTFPIMPKVRFAHDNIIPQIPHGYEIRPRLFRQKDFLNSTGGNLQESVECAPGAVDIRGKKAKNWVYVGVAGLVLGALALWYFNHVKATEKKIQ